MWNHLTLRYSSLISENRTCWNKRVFRTWVPSANKTGCPDSVAIPTLPLRIKTVIDEPFDSDNGESLFVNRHIAHVGYFLQCSSRVREQESSRSNDHDSSVLFDDPNLSGLNKVSCFVNKTEILTEHRTHSGCRLASVNDLEHLF